jgi:hypothetical protein
VTHVTAQAPPLGLRDLHAPLNQASGTPLSSQTPPPMSNASSTYSATQNMKPTSVHKPAALPVVSTQKTPQTPPDLQLPSSQQSYHDTSPQDLTDGHAALPASGASEPRLEDSMAKSIVMSEQLEALTLRVPLAGQTVSAIIRLMDLCVAARPVAQNARELARLCLDVVDLIEDLVDVDNILNEAFFKVCREFWNATHAGEASVGVDVRDRIVA